MNDVAPFVERIRLLLLFVYAIGFLGALAGLLIPSLTDNAWSERVPLLRALFAAYSVIGGIIWAGRFATGIPPKLAPSTWVVVVATAVGYNVAFLVPCLMYAYQFRTGHHWLKTNELTEYLNWVLVAGVAGTYPLLDFFKKADGEPAPAPGKPPPAPE